MPEWKAEGKVEWKDEWKDEIRRRLAPLRLPAHREASLTEELGQHLDDHYRDLVAAGMPDAEARSTALAGIERHELMRELRRVEAPVRAEPPIADTGSGRIAAGLLQDLRYATRMLRRRPGFTAVAVLTLALGIGANTAVFSIVNAVLLRPPPYAQPERLVKIWGRYSKEGIPQNWISEPEWWDMREALRSFSSMAAYATGGGANLTRDGSQPLRVTTTVATAGLFPLLGVQPLLGRVFTAEDDQPGRDRVVVLDYGFWTSQLAGDRSAVGRTIQLNGQAYTVIGVLPRGFAFGGDAELWLPLGLDRAKPNGRGSHYLEVIARLAPGVSLAQAGAELDGFVGRMATQYPRNYGPDTGFGMFLRPLGEEVVGDVRAALIVVFTAVAIVLLMACINLANLLLARSSARSREMGVRAALGAGRLRLVRQLVTESVLVAIVGGACGVLLALWGTGALAAVTQKVLPATSPIAVDGRVLAYAAGVSILTGILFGLAPAWQLSSPHIYEALKDAARESSAAYGHRLRSVLVVAEIAVALVLLVAAGLMVRSLQHLLDVSPGFQPQHLLTARVSLPASAYKDEEATSVFYRDLVRRLAALPGVQAAGITSLLPMSGNSSSGSTFVQQTPIAGLPVFDPFKAPYLEADQRGVTPDFFKAMRIALVRGRFFTAADTATAPPVAIVDEDFARRLWPGRDPIGQQIATGAVPNSNPPAPLWRTVVGVVGHVKNDSLDREGREQVYVPDGQRGFRMGNAYLALRAAVDPTALAAMVRRQVHALDPSLPVFEVRTMDDRLAESVAPRRFNMLLLVGFGVLALALAVVGTYGVIAYSVSQRTQEIGIRMALGATGRDVLGMVLAGALRLAAIGVAIGVLLAAAATRLLSSLLFGVRTTDPVTFGATAAILLAAAVTAAYLPARRATRVDPMAALRSA
jgi:predicted permease